MQLQYYSSEGGLTPQDGSDMLRMLQFLELAYLQVRPHAPGGKARPQVPEKFLLLTCIVPSNLAITLVVLPPLTGTLFI